MMPVLFLSHGSPMHAVSPGIVGDAWAALGKRIRRPDAVLMCSAHWETSLPMVTGQARPQTIHDFGGFPRALYDIRYPAPGSPALAATAVQLLKTAGITAGVDGCRGLDHGAWVPLRWMYADADVPVVQLAVQPDRGTAHHVALGRALAPLREQNILIVGSGHATHNLGDWAGHRGQSQPRRYAVDFSRWLVDTLAARDEQALIDYRERAPSAARAHPTDEHWLPLLVAYGAAGNDATVERVVDGFENGALALDSFLFDNASRI
jgi:4,5-DOPA dioxygenase extradiol